jgi:hypothetical protein
MWPWKSACRRDPTPTWGGAVSSGPVRFHPVLRTAQAIVDATRAGGLAAVVPPSDECGGPATTPPRAA